MSTFREWSKRSLTDLAALLKFLAFFAMTAGVLTVTSKWVATATKLPGAVSFIIVCVIGLVVNHYWRRDRPEPSRKNSPYVQFDMSFDGRRYYTTINGVKFVIRDCVCTEARVWVLKSGRFRLEMNLVVNDSTGVSYGFVQELTSEFDLSLILTACRQLKSEYDPPSALSVECLFEGNDLRGIRTSPASDRKCVAYMWQ